MTQVARASITPARESKMGVGTSMDDVHHAPGQPAHEVHFRHAADLRWACDLNTGSKHTDYELVFDSAGKVEWIEEHDYPME
jgi:hypothetical protein